MPTPMGPYSPVVRAGGWIITSGQVGMGDDGKIVPGGVADEARQAIRNVAALLESEGASLDDVRKTTVYLRHMRDFSIMNEVYAAEFGENRPARSCVAV